MNAEKIYNRIIELKHRGLRASEIATSLNKEGFKKKNNTDFTRMDVYNYVSSKSKQTRAAKKTMVTIPVETKTNRMMAVIGEVDDVERLIEKFLGAA